MEDKGMFMFLAIDLYMTVYCKFKNYGYNRGHSSRYGHRFTGKSPGIQLGQSGLAHGFSFR